MRLPRVLAGLDAEFLDHPRPQFPVDVQRLGAAPHRGQRVDQLGVRTLAQRVAGDRNPQLADDLGAWWAVRARVSSSSSADDEEQYSVWPQGKEIPPGWRAEGTVGTRAECLEHIDAVWTDLRPRSLP